MTKKKAGPWSKKDKEFIAENAATMSVEEIAETLGRNEDAVKKYIAGLTQNKNISKAKALHAEHNIKNSPIWKDLKKQFSESELEMFVYHWRRIIAQFNNDVFPTEEFQIIDAVKLELLMSRILSRQQELRESIDGLEKAITAAELEDDYEKANEYKRQHGILLSAREATEKDYRDNLAKKHGILKELRATRDQRVKAIESSRETMIGWMKRVIEDGDLREKLGYDMEKMRMAKEKERERLSQYHKYEDEVEDIPFLNPETVENL